MKRVIKLSLILSILAMIFCNLVNVYAVSSCKISMQTNKTEYTNEDEIIAIVRISNIQSEMGIISIGMTLEYDKNSLELVTMEGQNGWDTPVHGASYNKDNGVMALTKSGLAKNDENVIKLVFKIKENKNQNTSIVLKNITASDSSLIKIDGNVSKNIIVKEKINSNPKPNDPKPSDPEPSNPTQNEQKPDNSIQSNQTTNDKYNTDKNTNQAKENLASGELPKTGGSNIILPLIIGIIVICTIIIIYIKVRR